MNDQDLTKILPAWGGWNKRKQEKVWKQYQAFSSDDKAKVEFDILSK